jgi:hypothetical protein
MYGSPGSIRLTHIVCSDEYLSNYLLVSQADVERTANDHSLAVQRN